MITLQNGLHVEVRLTDASPGHGTVRLALAEAPENGMQLTLHQARELSQQLLHAVYEARLLRRAPRRPLR